MVFQPTQKLNAQAGVTVAGEFQIPNYTHTLNIGDIGATSVPGIWTRDNLRFTIYDGAIIKIIGQSHFDRHVVIDDDATVTIVLESAMIRSNGNNAGIRLGTDSTLTLVLVGTNNIRGGELGTAGIRTTGGNLIIDGTGTLNVEGNSFTNFSGGAGIGGNLRENGGHVTINGGTINATGGENGGAGIGGGAGSGSGNEHIAGNGGTVIINDGTVTATGGNGGSAGIGGGGTIVFGLQSIARGGPGGNITINGGTVVARANPTSGSFAGGGAGIGGGAVDGNAPITTAGAGGVITITNGDVTAIGGNPSGAPWSFGGAGIGGGGARGSATAGAGGTILIENGIVRGTGANGGAGIGGGGAGGDGIAGNGGNITIQGGTVTARTSGLGSDVTGAAIGGGGIRSVGPSDGVAGDGGVILITGGTISADSGTSGGAGIGGGVANEGTGGNGGMITITGGNVTAAGAGGFNSSAGIGSGGRRYPIGGTLVRGDAGTITIGGDAVVNATGGGWNGSEGTSAIGGGALSDGGIITIDDTATVTTRARNVGIGGPGAIVGISDKVNITNNSSQSGLARSDIFGDQITINGGTLTVGNIIAQENGTINITSGIIESTSVGISDGAITITGDAVVSAIRTTFAFGLDGIGGQDATINIAGNANVVAQGGSSAAGIGGFGSSVNISGNVNVTATGDVGIGAGGSSGGGLVTTVNISDGIINASGNPDIGTSMWGATASVTITGGIIAGRSRIINGLTSQLFAVRIQVRDTNNELVNGATVTANGQQVTTGKNRALSEFGVFQETLDVGVTWLWLPAGEFYISATHGTEMGSNTFTVPSIHIQNDIVIRLSPFTVSFNLNGGQGTAPNPVTGIAYDATVQTTLKPSTATFTKTGYINTGNWYTRAKIDDEYVYTLFEFGVTQITNDVTVFLQWRQPTNQELAQIAVDALIAAIAGNCQTTIQNAKTALTQALARSGVVEANLDTGTHSNITALTTAATARITYLSASENNGGLGGGAIAGIIIGAIIALGAIGFGVWHFVIKPRRIS